MTLPSPSLAGGPPALRLAGTHRLSRTLAEAAGWASFVVAPVTLLLGTALWWRGAAAGADDVALALPTALTALTVIAMTAAMQWSITRLLLSRGAAGLWRYYPLVPSAAMLVGLAALPRLLLVTPPVLIVAIATLVWLWRPVAPNASAAQTEVPDPRSMGALARAALPNPNASELASDAADVESVESTDVKAGEESPAEVLPQGEAPLRVETAADSNAAANAEAESRPTSALEAASIDLDQLADLENEELDPALTQRIERRQLPEGEAVSFWQRVEVPAWTRQAAVHIPFWPPLCAPPKIVVEGIADAEVSVRVEQAERHGCRLRIQLHEVDERPQWVEIEGLAESTA